MVLASYQCFADQDSSEWSKKRNTAPVSKPSLSKGGADGFSRLPTCSSWCSPDLGSKHAIRNHQGSRATSDAPQAARSRRTKGRTEEPPKGAESVSQWGSRIELKTTTEDRTALNTGNHPRMIHAAAFWPHHATSASLFLQFIFIVHIPPFRQSSYPLLVASQQLLVWWWWWWWWWCNVFAPFLQLISFVAYPLVV